jgi:hypothetical protein
MRRLSKATYEIIEDEEPFYEEIPELRGVWVSERLWKNATRT